MFNRKNIIERRIMLAIKNKIRDAQKDYDVKVLELDQSLQNKKSEIEGQHAEEALVLREKHHREDSIHMEKSLEAHEYLIQSLVNGVFKNIV